MPSDVAAIVREIQPESLPDLFENVDLDSPTLLIEPEQEEHWKDFVHSAPMMGLSELTILVGLYAYEMQTRDRIIVDSVKLVKQVLSSEVLAAIAAYWILRDPESFPETVNRQKRLSYHFLTFLHGLKQTSDEDHDQAFRAVFVFLIEHLAGLDTHSNFGINIPLKIWRNEVAPWTKSAPDDFRATFEVMQKRDLARATSPTVDESGVTTEDSLVVEGSRKRKSVRYLSPSTLYGPSPEKFRKISDAPFADSRAASASASSDSPRAHEEPAAVADLSSARNVPKVVGLQRSLLGSIKSWFGY